MSLDIIQPALLVGLAYFITYGGNWLLGQNMADQPIVVGPLVGWLLGDFQLGLLLGASLQAVFMGAVNVGGAVSLNPSFGTALGVAFAIISGGGEEVALAIAVPIGLLGGMMEVAGNSLAAPMADACDRAAEEGDDKKIVRIHFGVWFIKSFIYAAIAFAAVLLGANLVTDFIDMLPEFIINGLGVVSGILPGVGFALLLNMIWSRELAVYYFVGFILFMYLDLPLVAIAVLGIAIAVVVAGIDYKINQNSGKSNNNDSSDDNSDNDSDLDNEMEAFLS